MPSYTHLTPMERGQIKAFLEPGLRQQSIADRLGRAPYHIARELKRTGAKPSVYRQQPTYRQIDAAGKNDEVHPRRYNAI